MITQLVFDFLKLCRLDPVEIRTGIWQVQVDDALMKELDGWRAQGRLLQFTFDQHLAESYGADLICPGSYRLNSIIQVIRKQGILSHSHIPHHFFHEPSIRKKVLGNLGAIQRAYVVNSSLQYGQYLQLQILVSAQGLQKKESIHTPVVNLSSGQVLKFAIPTHLLRAGGVAPETVRKRKCSLKKAFSSAVTFLSEELAQADHDWAQQAFEKLELEKERLAGYFDGRTASEEFATKTQELHKRLAPKVQMDALRGAILFVPLFCYRLVIVDPSGNERTKNLFYDPINNLQELD